MVIDLNKPFFNIQQDLLKEIITKFNGALDH
jgi:hypothetical protein